MYYSPQAIVLNKTFFSRDAVFFGIGLIALLYAIVIRGKIDMTMSILFIVLYFGYVLVVFFQDRAFEKMNNSEAAKQAQLATNMTELNNLERFGQVPMSAKNTNATSYDFESQFKEESTAFFYSTSPQPSNLINDRAANE